MDHELLSESYHFPQSLQVCTEEIGENDKIPIVVRGPRLNCEFCAARNFKRDAECIQCYQKNGVIRCVFEVKTEDVIQAVDEVIISLKQK